MYGWLLSLEAARSCHDIPYVYSDLFCRRPVFARPSRCTLVSVCSRCRYPRLRFFPDSFASYSIAMLYGLKLSQIRLHPLIEFNQTLPLVFHRLDDPISRGVLLSQFSETRIENGISPRVLHAQPFHHAILFRNRISLPAVWQLFDMSFCPFDECFVELLFGFALAGIYNEGFQCGVLRKAEVLQFFYTFDCLGYALSYATGNRTYAYNYDPALVDVHVGCKCLEALDCRGLTNRGVFQDRWVPLLRIDFERYLKRGVCMCSVPATVP